MPERKRVEASPKDGIYCSSWCGCRCTKRMYDAAVRGARSLCADLGPGWQPEVHENVGWHYKARSECGRISVFGTTSYTAGLGRPGENGYFWVAYGRTPKAAVRNLVAKIRDQLGLPDSVEIGPRAVDAPKRALAPGRK